jgi:DNA polymerase III epsilon subunit-like protein
MIFDTETTGLPLKKKDEKKEEKNELTTTHKKIHRELKSIVDFKTAEKYPITYTDIHSIDQQPYMTQLSFLIVDEAFNIVFHYNHYLQLPEHIVISEFITGLTGITKEMCNAGTPPLEALKTFISWFFKCHRIVAHNIHFDRTILRIEMARHYSDLKQVYPFLDVVFHSSYDRVTQLDHYDTMIRGNKICGIMIPTKSGEGTKLKLPKLVEMYKLFFHATPENLHNSMVDVLVTTRCYLKLKYHRDVDDVYFNRLVELAIHGKNINGHLIEFANSK